MSFWLHDPFVLIHKDFILNIWPTESMKYNEKMNSISRLLLITSILGFSITYSFSFLVIGIVTLLLVIYIYQKKEITISHPIIDKEGFTTKKSIDIIKKEFKKTEMNNPMSNLMLHEIIEDTQRKSAPPAFNPKVEKDINTKTKEMIISLNDSNEDMESRLFKDLGDNLEFEQSMRNFHTMPNTQVANDQNAFAKYLYGDMKSHKDGDYQTAN